MGIFPVAPAPEATLGLSTGMLVAGLEAMGRKSGLVDGAGPLASSLAH
jgi:hypothetical protein